ncbi:uncharacterized protein BX663DRAFT_505671 [Cokeromyces recurvatus]|uniref:uncharacterized protein n=1 Tax=Cokeromyces recurvatus TaxID=90255 RepID=UPI00222058A2|nr:uncharacterized protein BX663DRAFT_505671 [Cokeromyces recurvatus]KAI7903912.1 hypothetical protein BX663DRAFT_505671 [Cokeromyces recurvatus]
MEEFIRNYCTCESDNKSKHIIENHVDTILTNILQPIFQKEAVNHPILSRKPKSKYGTDDFIDKQEWKTNNYVDILMWITDNISAKKLESNLHLILPPIMIVLDDYDIEYKIKGIKMVHKMISLLDSSFISRNGLDNVFFESLFKCTSYLSQDRDEPLLRVTYACLLDLLAKRKKDQKTTELYERVLKDGIVTGFIYAGEKIKFLPVLIKPISVLYEELGIIGVQYLKAIVPILCDSISMYSGHNPAIKEINLMAAQSLIIIIKKCWPRIPAYKGKIIQAIAKAWTYYFNKKDDTMCQLLKELYRIFEAACQGQEKADKDALVAFNPSVFEPLFT